MTQTTTKRTKIGRRRRRTWPRLQNAVQFLTFFFQVLIIIFCAIVVHADNAGPVGKLRVSDIQRDPKVFDNFASNTSITLNNNGNSLQVLQGSVHQINNLQNKAMDMGTEFSVLPNTLPRDTVQDILQLLTSYPHLDEDPDTVDGMPTYEIFVDSPELYQPSSSNKVRDSDLDYVEGRKDLRAKLQAWLQPTLQNVITPFVQEHVSGACQNKHGDRKCTPCYSLIRRYRHGDRVSHGTHHDGHALATVVVSLSDYGTEYRGGLYVSTGYGQEEREYLQLNRGDAVVHQSTLLHGVQVHDLEDNPEDTTRWSWILWFRDSTECQDYSHEWFADCAAASNPLCQQLHSTKIGNIPGITQQQAADTILELNRKAAESGAGTAAVKMARAYLGLLPSKLAMDVNQAKYYYKLAIQSHHPDGHYGMAQLLLQEAKEEQNGRRNYNTDERVLQAVRHLEAASKLHHTYAQYNLGMAHTYGYGTGVIDGALAAEWFIQSGMPEGYFIAAQQAMTVGDTERSKELAERAQALGFFAPWRTQAREATGSGGAGGVNLNLPWPVADDGREAFQLPSQLPPLQNVGSSLKMTETKAESDDANGAPTDTKAPISIPESTSQKALKEAAVTGHEGSSHPWEVLWLCLSVVSGCAAYNAAVAFLQMKRKQPLSTVGKVLLEAILLWFPMVLAQSEFLYPYGTCAIITQLWMAAVGLQVARSSKTTPKSTTKTASKPSTSRLEYLTLYRSSILYLTFIAILAVDFPSLFPRRFCKTEVSGYGLMDVGAASFCISAGLVGARRHIQQSSNKKATSPWKSFLHTLPLIAIGIIRILVNKELDYQEHVSEYGVHWNFFFTLGILTLVPALLGMCGKTTAPSIVGPLCIMAVYQILLSQQQWQQFIEEAPRRIQDLETWDKTNSLAALALQIHSQFPTVIVSFFVANREGILGCLGYLSLYYAGEWVGYHWLWGQKSDASTRMTLGKLAAFLWYFHLGVTLVLGIPVSRRSTNLGFCSWALAHNVVLLFGLQKLEEWIKPTTAPKEGSVAKSTIVPPIWEKANAHGLVMFLVANLLTGLVNLTVPTLETNALPALLIVFGYICSIGIAAVGIDVIFSFVSKRGSKSLPNSATKNKKKQ